jgi:hypothetical protein
MDFQFLAAANGITNTYFNNNNAVSAAGALDEEAKKKFGAEFADAYDSMVATKALNDSMRQSYEATHRDDFREHASRLGYSIDNRVIDMLHVQLSDDMNAKVSSAINNAIENL